MKESRTAVNGSQRGPKDEEKLMVFIWLEEKKMQLKKVSHHLNINELFSTKS